MIKGENGIQPAFQMISEKHDADFICYWLREILRDDAPIPPEVDCDYSMALLNATCLAFIERCLKMYILNCFCFLSSEKLFHPLHTYIRIDIAHLIKIICRKQVFERAPSSVKDFYVRCIGLISMCDNLKEFSEMLLSLLIVAKSEYSGQNEVGSNVICETKHTFWFDKIKNFNLNEENDDEREYEYLSDDVDDNPDIIDYIERIKQESESQVLAAGKTRTVNTFYCPGIISHLIKLARHFPLWTNVMSQYFIAASNVASSSRCETYFKDLKHIDLGPDYVPQRADKFVAKHIKSIESIAKLERAKNIKTSKKAAISKKAEKLNNDDNVQHLQYEENWYGLNKEANDKTLGVKGKKIRFQIIRYNLKLLSKM